MALQYVVTTPKRTCGFLKRERVSGKFRKIGVGNNDGHGYSSLEAPEALLHAVVQMDGLGLAGLSRHVCTCVMQVSCTHMDMRIQEACRQVLPATHHEFTHRFLPKWLGEHDAWRSRLSIARFSR